MSSYRKISSVVLLNQTVSGDVQSQALPITHLRACCFMVEVGSGISAATVNVQGSVENSVWGNLQIPISPVTGAINIPIDVVTGFGFVRVAISGVTGSGTIVVTGSAKGA